MKPRRITDGTCYNGTHWLDKEDCNSCKLLQECLKLNTPLTKIPALPVTKKEDGIEKVCKQPLTVVIETALLEGGLYDDVVTRINKKSTEEKNKIQRWIISICRKIRNNDPRWAKYQDISTEGHLQIKLR